MYLTTPKTTKTLRIAITRELVYWDEKYANFIAIIKSGKNWEIISPVFFQKQTGLNYEFTLQEKEYLNPCRSRTVVFAKSFGLVQIIFISPIGQF